MYNENDAFTVAWLTRLQERNLIPGGRIDGRSISELRPGDCGNTSHFFAGIGGWAYALQLAGWDPARDVWTGSCPCQPFSIAGRGTGTSDKRHLWPIWRDLIAECRPATIFGEQTSSNLGREWLDGVRADLEALGYAVGAADLCAASVNAPHRRQRLYWVADTGHRGDKRWNGFRDSEAGITGQKGENQGGGQVGPDLGRIREVDDLADGGKIGGSVDRMVNAVRLGTSNSDTKAEQGSDWQDHGIPGETGLSDFWNQFDIAECQAIDGSLQYRRIESGLLPVADGIQNRVGRIRGFGNAIVPQLAATFIQAFLSSR